MKIRELLSEDAAPKVGRKYQHLEDLLFTGIPNKSISAGSEAGLHAVRILNAMASASVDKNNKDSKGIELKWDGSPVVYWGRDEQGRFSMFPKNAWEYLKRGKTTLDNGTTTLLYKPQDVQNFILGTGDPKTAKDVAQRQSFSQEMMNLWPYLEKASPKKGYVEGGVLFSPIKPYTFNQDTQEFHFKPNITAFDIPRNSDLGRRIEKAKVMVAVTGYYDTLGSSDEGRFPNAGKLSTPDVIIQGTHYVEEAPGIDTELVNKASQYITANAAAINSFLAPKPGLTKVGDILYKFYNQNLRIAGVKEKFKSWATQNLSANQANKVINDPGLDAALTAVELLSDAKMDIYRRLSSMSHGAIRQTKPEGYVYQDPQTGQFVKAISQADWAPEKR